MADSVGTGEHVVLVLHGWFGSGSSWGNLIPHLDTERYTYVFPEYRGYGARKGETGDFSIEEAAADALEVVDRLGINGFSLVGHSMGGSVMQHVYADAPERVRAMVGVSPVPASGVPFDDDGWALFSGAADNPENRKAIIDFTTGGKHSGGWVDDLVTHSVENSDKAAVAAYLTAWAKTDFHERIVGAEVPVKVFVGENDPAIDQDTILTTFGQWYPKFDLEVLPDAGHYAADEVPVTLANAIEVFLDEH